MLRSRTYLLYYCENSWISGVLRLIDFQIVDIPDIQVKFSNYSLEVPKFLKTRINLCNRLNAALGKLHVPRSTTAVNCNISFPFCRGCLLPRRHCCSKDRVNVASVMLHYLSDVPCTLFRKSMMPNRNIFLSPGFYVLR